MCYLITFFSVSGSLLGVFSLCTSLRGPLTFTFTYKLYFRNYILCFVCLFVSSHGHGLFLCLLIVLLIVNCVFVSIVNDSSISKSLSLVV